MKAHCFGLLIVTAACSGAQHSSDTLAKSMAATRGAEEAGARNVPEAKLHLTLAEEELERARKLAADGEDERADRMALRAGVDADLARALARADAKRREAEVAQASAQKRKQELSPGESQGGTPTNQGAPLKEAVPMNEGALPTTQDVQNTP